MPEINSGADLISPAVRFKPAVLRAVKAFRRSKPWRGNRAERLDKFRVLHSALCAAYAMAEPALQLSPVEVSGGLYSPSRNIIVLGNLSVVTYLHEFAHARGFLNETTATRWSANLFARCFPRSYGRCRWDGLFLVRDDAPSAVIVVPVDEVDPFADTPPQPAAAPAETAPPVAAIPAGEAPAPATIAARRRGARAAANAARIARASADLGQNV